MSEKIARIAAIDPVTIEVIRYRLLSIPEQIETNIVRTAYSPLIYEYKDYAVGLTDAKGRLITQGRGGIPLFVANIIGLAVNDGLVLYGAENIHAGDVIICNYSGVLGQHLNNVVMYTPTFASDGSLFGFMAVVAHWADVGGRTVGSSTPTDTTDIFQEGIQLRTLKLWNQGKKVADIYRVIEHNTRFPEMVLGDLEAQLAGCVQGRALFEEMCASYGAKRLSEAIAIIWSQSEQRARQIIRDIPDGAYKASAFLDDDGVDEGRRIEIPVTVSVKGETITVDYSEVSAEVKGPFNSGAQGGGVTAARMALNFLINPEDGCNEGTYRPLDVILPEGKFLSAGPNAPMAKYSAPLATVIDVIIRALGEALPERACAGHHGTFGVHTFVGRDPRSGKLFKNLETAQGGWGATAGYDGAGPFKTFAHGDTLNVPVELQEALYPLRFEELSLRPDSGGAGEFRGGLGITKLYRILAPCRLNVGFDRVGCPPWGVNGGKSGVPGRVVLERPGDEPRTYFKAEILLRPGDLVRIETGGGGGYGFAEHRTRERIESDLMAGYVTPVGCERDYTLPRAAE